MAANRGPTSINIDQELWKEVKKAAIDLGITATDFLEQALREKLSKRKNN
jgi:Ribbon-helix-helix protein, copG family